MARLGPVHPEEILKHDLIEPFGLSNTALAKAIGVTPARINQIVRGRRGITAETALRLAKFFRTDAQSWMNLQDQYELAVAEHEAAAAIKAIRPMLAHLAPGVLPWCHPPGEQCPMSTTSLKLPDELKQRAAAAARHAGVTPHAFMVAAIEQATASAEARARFVAQAEAARKDTLDTGKGYDAAAVHDYLRDRIAGKRTPRPRARQWRG